MFFKVHTAILVVSLLLIESVLCSWLFSCNIFFPGNFTGRVFSIIIFVVTTVFAVFITGLPSRITDFEDKAVLITGCDRGFGYLLAKQLSSQGFFVFAGCLNSKGSGALELAEAMGPSKGIVLPMNVTSDEEVAKAASTVKNKLAEINRVLWAVVNNAGVASLSLIETAPLNEYRRMFEINTLGVIRVCQTFIPLLRGHGRFVNLTSLASRIWLPIFSTYCVSKTATLVFSNVLRLEMKAFNIKVSTVEPGLYRTSMVEEQTANSIVNEWPTYSQDIRDAYGDEYFETCVKISKLQTKQARTNLTEVVDTLEQAIVEVEPRFQYVPSFAHWLQFVILKHIFPESEMRDQKLIKRVLPRLVPKFMRNQKE